MLLVYIKGPVGWLLNQSLFFFKLLGKIKVVVICIYLNWWLHTLKPDNIFFKRVFNHNQTDFFLALFQEKICAKSHTECLLQPLVWRSAGGSSRVAKLTHDRNMQLQPQPAAETADKNVYVTVGTAVKLHFPVVHVSFVLSAELRPCWFICSRKEEPLRKTSISLQPAPTKRREPSRSCCLEILMK